MRVDPSFVGGVVFLAATLAAPACVDLAGVTSRYIDKEEKRFTVSGKPDVALTTFDGSIEIRGSDRSDVLVVIEKYGLNKEAAAAIQVRVEQKDNHITVDATRPIAGTIFGWHHSDRVRLVVSIPIASNVLARSGDGSIAASNVNGEIDLVSGDGSIHGTDLVGTVKVRTGDGSISLEALDGAADVTTGDGSIRVDGKLKVVRARTGDGSVRVRAAPGSAADQDWDISTGDGSVALDLADGFSGELDAHTNDGGIHLNDVRVSNVSGEVSRGSVRGRLGNGGHALRVRTGDGSITLRSSR